MHAIPGEKMALQKADVTRIVLKYVRIIVIIVMEDAEMLLVAGR